MKRLVLALLLCGVTLGLAGCKDETPAPAPSIADSNTPRPCPQYLKRNHDDRPPETAEEKHRKWLKLNAHEVLRARAVEPLWAPDEVIEQVMQELSQTDRRRTG